jgi:hypothetical protein
LRYAYSEINNFNMTVPYSWVDYTQLTNTEPMLVTSNCSNGSVSGEVYSYTGPFSTDRITSLTVYRFVPTSYTYNGDAIYSNYTSGTQIVSGLIISRATI